MENVDDGTIIPIFEWPITTSPPAAASAVVAQRPEPEIGRTDCSEVQMFNPRNYCSDSFPPLTLQPLSSTFSEPQIKKLKPDTKSCVYEVQSKEGLGSVSESDCREETLISDSGTLKESRQICTVVEPLAQVRVARWWRRNKHHLVKQSLPETNNPHTMLYHISRTKDCVSFLLEEKRKLQKSCRLHSKARPDTHAAVASIDDWLGNYKTALDNISLAVNMEPTNSKYRWLKAKLQKQCNAMDTQKAMMGLTDTAPRTFPAVIEVERISATGLGKDEFISRFVARRQPVILLDIVEDMATSTWDLDFVASVAGSIKAAVKCAAPFSVEWAKLEHSQEIAVGEFINQVKGGQTSDYLFDWSLPIHCPQLAQDLTIPKYFSDNFLQRTSPGTMYHDSWPSLFIAPKGTVSSLHVDAFASNFWMALFQGEKRWTFFDADDTPLLYPQYVHSMDPVFSVDLSHPDVDRWPLLALTKPRQCVLRPGELLFVPAGSPHFVENLSDSLAVSSNHVDHSNYKQVCDELRINALVDPRAADLLQQLEQTDFLQKVEENS